MELMAGFPSMIKVTGQKIEGDKIVISFYVRFWHPAAWRMVWQRCNASYELTALDRLRVIGFTIWLAVRSIFRFR